MIGYQGGRPRLGQSLSGMGPLSGFNQMLSESECSAPDSYDSDSLHLTGAIRKRRPSYGETEVPVSHGGGEGSSKFRN